MPQSVPREKPRLAALVLLSSAWLIATLGLALGVVHSALADAGGFPTSTPTQTATLTHTPTETLLPTPTNTLEPSPIAHGGGQPVAAPASTSPRPRLEIICWPLAVGLMLVIALVIVWVMGRQQTE